MKVFNAAVLVGLALLSSPSFADDYRINPGDVLSVFVWSEENLTHEIIVLPDGSISYPLAGKVAVGGSTVDEAEQALTEALAKFLKDTPTVTISPMQLAGNKIYVLGKVNRPGEYPINRPTDVMQALALAGGLNTFAAENGINVLRRSASGEQQAMAFRYGDVKDGDELASNIVLKAGDVVVVP
jgi:polysaccharide export outer membrane protein